MKSILSLSLILPLLTLFCAQPVQAINGQQIAKYGLEYTKNYGVPAIKGIGAITLAYLARKSQETIGDFTAWTLLFGSSIGLALWAQNDLNQLSS